MKKKILALSLALGVFALILSAGTLAYFTDKTPTVKNTFTVGSVEIELLESKLHRVNAGVTTAGRLSWDTTVEGYAMNGAAGSAPADSHGWAGAYYTDEQIEADAANYQAYLAEAGQGLVPGENVMKAPYVKNTGKSDAFVRIRVLSPKALDDAGGLISPSMYTDSALKGAAVLTTSEETRDGIDYNVYTFTYQDAIKPGKMTFWNAWGDIKISNTATEADIDRLIDGGILTSDGEFSVLVEADAIQAGGFTDATAAFAAFDAQN